SICFGGVGFCVSVLGVSLFGFSSFWLGCSLEEDLSAAFSSFFALGASFVLFFSLAFAAAGVSFFFFLGRVEVSILDKSILPTTLGPGPFFSSSGFCSGVSLFPSVSSFSIAFFSSFSVAIEGFLLSSFSAGAEEVSVTSGLSATSFFEVLSTEASFFFFSFATALGRSICSLFLFFARSC